MADPFGLKIGLEGEKEFKKSIAEINQEFKVLGSEMKLVTAQFDKNDNSIEALTARQSVLTKEVDAQRQKVETLRAAMQNAAEAFGENDRRTQACLNYFEYKGIRSSDMGLRIEEKEVFSGPQYGMEFDEIPGRDGDLIRSGGRFPNVQVTYSVFLPAKSAAELSTKIAAVKAWLYTDLDRYHQLTDTYNPNFYRKAVFAGKLDIEDELNRIGLFTVSFSSLPFQYSEEGGMQTEYATGDTVNNPYPFPSKPYIKVYGSGEGTLTLQSASHNSTWKFLELDGYLEIDSEQMNFYKGAMPKNDLVEGSGFPVLYPGENAITFTGGITKIEIEPRWQTL